jgi:hypothetical protein
MRPCSRTPANYRLALKRTQRVCLCLASFPNPLCLRELRGLRASFSSAGLLRAHISRRLSCPFGLRQGRRGKAGRFTYSRKLGSVCKLESRPAIEVTQVKKAVEVAITEFVRRYVLRSRPAENRSRPPGSMAAHTVVDSNRMI